MLSRVRACVHRLVLCAGACVQIAETTPLVGEREDLSSLAKEYAEDDAIYQSKIQVSTTSLKNS